MKHLEFVKKATLVAVASFALVSCRDTDSVVGVEEQGVVQKDVISNITNNVIISTYQDLNQKALHLKNKIDEMTVGNEQALLAARQAWIEARSPWEKSEGFLYGPVDTEGLDPALDTWPVDVQGMNNIINGNQTITAGLIAANNEVRGFHLIEYLLWGEDGNKQAHQFTPREIEYLKAAAQDLQNNTQKLHLGWITSGGNFAQYFLNPNPNSPAYKSEKDVLVEITDGIFTICDEVANTKIAEPLTGDNQAPAPEKEESRFSHNSKKDFSDNIRSVKNIYLGVYGNGGNGKGISNVVKGKNEALDNEIRLQIDEAIMAIDAIPGTFSSAIFNNRPEVMYAQEKVAKLMDTIEKKLKPFINNL